MRILPKMRAFLAEAPVSSTKSPLMRPEGRIVAGAPVPFRPLRARFDQNRASIPAIKVRPGETKVKTCS